MRSHHSPIQSLRSDDFWWFLMGFPLVRVSLLWDQLRCWPWANARSWGAGGPGKKAGASTAKHGKARLCCTQGLYAKSRKSQSFPAHDLPLWSCMVGFLHLHVCGKVIFSFEAEVNSVITCGLSTIEHPKMIQKSIFKYDWNSDTNTCQNMENKISIYLYIYIYISISIYLYISISMYWYLYIPISLYLYISMSLCLYVILYLYISISPYLYISMSLCHSISLYLYICIYLILSYLIWSYLILSYPSIIYLCMYMY